MIHKWFLSRTVRQAVAMRRHVDRLLNAQRDLLTPQGIAAVRTAMGAVDQAIREGANKGALRLRMEELEFAANERLKPYPHAAWRENVEVLLVALAVAMGIRTFFLQPFKIPTGSMQPTLFGVMSEPDFSRPPWLGGNTNTGFTIPTGWERVRGWFAGVSYVRVVARNEGPLQLVEEPLRFLIFNIRQRLVVGGETYTLWFPPDYGGVTLASRAGLSLGQRFRKGEEIVRLRVRSGDHLFVNRLVFNFLRPARGDIVVFETAGVDHPQVPKDQFYIKRLIGLGPERIKIGPDNHLVANGRRLDAADAGFEFVYSYRANSPTNDYLGHMLAPGSHFATPFDEFSIRPGHFMVMGDNTRNSLDSRYFGDVSERFIIGRASFVYWPLSSRFGFGYR